MFLTVGLCAQARMTLARELVLPRAIEVTQEDIKEMDSKGTLRGRTVPYSCFWEPRRARWDGIQVFTGRKSDVINWFLGGQEGLGELGGFRDTASMKGIQYNLLCSALLQTGDLDIIRVMIWEVRGDDEYLRPDWKQLVGDRRLTTAERIVAWARSPDRDRPEDFWTLFGKELTADDILTISSRADYFTPWRVFYALVDNRLSPFRERARALLGSLVRREYLSIARGLLVSQAVRALEGLAPRDRQHISAVLDRIVEWDALGDERSAVLWKGTGAPADYDAGLARRVRDIAMRARCSENAAIAFWNYTRTPLGIDEVRKAEGGWQRYFEAYLARLPADYNTAIGLLAALAGHTDLHGNFTDPGDRPLRQYLEEGKVTLTVSKQLMARLEQAWRRHVPQALEHVRLKE
jgi:hypothetical protein